MLSDCAIEVRDLGKSFRVMKPSMGSWISRLGKYVWPDYRQLDVVQNLNFTIRPGEHVGLIGPNGSGKSTIIKMLTGIFLPSSGQVRVHGLDPYAQRYAVMKQIGVVFGHKSHLWPSLTVRSSLKLLCEIYEVESKQRPSRIESVVEQFHIQDFIDRPVRELSLGQRTRCELAASMLHHPSVLFLDEPTIGLDIVSRAAVRTCLKERSRDTGMSLILTSHDIADIEQICSRILIIGQGSLVLDASLEEAKSRYLYHKLITVETEAQEVAPMVPGLRLMKRGPLEMVYEVDTRTLGVEEAAQWLLTHLRPIRDLSVVSPSLEEFVRSIYQNKPLAALGSAP